MLCHSPSLMAVKNRSRLNFKHCIIGEKEYFSLEEPVVDYLLILSSVFFDSSFIELLKQ
jgi:hypothetical protein